MLIYLIIGLVFTTYDLFDVVYTEGYRKRIINKISEIRDNLHRAGWNISFKQCYVISMTFAVIIVALAWPWSIIHKIIRNILDFKNKT